MTDCRHEATPHRNPHTHTHNIPMQDRDETIRLYISPVCVIRRGPRCVTAGCFLARFFFFFFFPPSSLTAGATAVLSRGASPSTLLCVDDDNDSCAPPAGAFAAGSSANSLSSASCTDSPANPSNLNVRGHTREQRHHGVTADTEEGKKRNHPRGNCWKKCRSTHNKS